MPLKENNTCHSKHIYVIHSISIVCYEETIYIIDCVYVVPIDELIDISYIINRDSSRDTKHHSIII